MVKPNNSGLLSSFYKETEAKTWIMRVTIFILSDTYRIAKHFVCKNVFLAGFTDKLTRADFMLEVFSM